MPAGEGASDEMTAPFLFVPTGDPEPTEWMAAHPGWIKLPATFVPLRPERPGGAFAPGTALALGATEAAFGPAIFGGIGTEVAEGFAAGLGLPLATLGMLLYPSRTAGPEQDELYPHGEGFAAHPPMPPLPGPTPPVANTSPPGTGGFTPAAPTLRKARAVLD